jgi:hypothetical protein
MTPEERDEVRLEATKELIKQGISLAAFIITLIAYQCTIDKTYREVQKARIRKLLNVVPKRDREQEALRQVQKEISLMEHGEYGGV